jgi:hypothetical protein
VNNLSMSVRGGGDRYSYYISGDQLDNEGYLFNSRDLRRSMRSNFTFTPTSTADFTVNVGYIRQDLRSASRRRGRERPAAECRAWHPRSHPTA